jgi:hypothetical protein
VPFFFCSYYSVVFIPWSSDCRLFCKVIAQSRARL